MCYPNAHEWKTIWEGRGGAFSVKRKCKKCGSTQRGTYHPAARYITWNAIAEAGHGDVRPQQA